MKNFQAQACVAALALLGATAHAQSTVTLYGVVDVFVEYGKAGTRDNPTDMVRLQSGGINSARLGFRGTEDLGGGMRTLFTLEGGLLADSGRQADSNAFFNRQAFVGLQGSWGTLTAGRQYTPLLVQQDGFNPAPGTTLYGSAYNSGVIRSVSRANNSILYASPTAGGLSGQLMVAMGESDLGNSYGALASANVKYTRGPFATGLAWLRQNRAEVDGASKTIVNLAAGYTLGDWQLLGAVQTTTNDSRAANQEDDRNEFLLGSTYLIGAGQLRVSYGQAKVKRVADTTVSHFSAGYLYNLSKLTAVYVIAQSIDNPDNLAYRSTGYTFDAVEGGLPAGAGVNARALAFGVRHRF